MGERMQKFYTGIIKLQDILMECSPQKVLMVCAESFESLSISGYLKMLPVPFVRFDSFRSNPLYEDVINGVRTFNENGCDFILAVGGGSAMDVAKCIKLFCRMDQNQSLLGQFYERNGIPLLAIPTTSGTGSESTRFAVIYHKGEKQSITNDDILPSHVILEPGVLRTLPVFQKKCTMLDAFCQAVESWWSVNSTDDSRKLSKQAVQMIVSNRMGYLDNNDECNEAMLKASNLAGQAINITQTTAAHAMSYKLTSLYGIPHGYAVAMCLPAVFRYMLEYTDRCIDPRGTEYLRGVFADIAAAAGMNHAEKVVLWLEELLTDLESCVPEKVGMDQLEILARSVNLTRLKNNPVSIGNDTALELYKKILHSKGE
jgi:alcohol dehydrogenase class IV